MRALDIVNAKDFEQYLWNDKATLRALHATHTAFKLPVNTGIDAIRKHLIETLKSQGNLLLADPFSGGETTAKDLTLLAGVEATFRPKVILTNSPYFTKSIRLTLGQGLFEGRSGMSSTSPLAYERAFRLACWAAFNTSAHGGIKRAAFGVPIGRGKIPDFLVLTNHERLIALEFKANPKDYERFPSAARAYSQTCDDVYLVTSSRLLFAIARRRNRGRNAAMHGPAYSLTEVQKELQSLQCGLLIVATDGSSRVLRRHEPHRPVFGRFRPETEYRDAAIKALEGASPYDPAEDQRFVEEACTKHRRGFTLKRESSPT